MIIVDWTLCIADATYSLWSLDTTTNSRFVYPVLNDQPSIMYCMCLGNNVLFCAQTSDIVRTSHRMY